ncbi:hypothetical protein FoTM2_003673 [Fusarium oxysporum f. sp. vasinfectum]|nr:hypothetical protein FoTM2_003673 [Fusarium oxysporum f. sp. vasinfectum]
MENVSKPPRRRRHAAMRDERELNDQGERARHERGMKPSQRSRSPRQVRDSRHDSDARRNRPPIRPDSHSSRRRRHSHDRSRDRASRLSPEPSRRGPEVEDLIPRYRERHREIEEKPRRRSQSRSPGHDYISRASPSAAKRHRSRSPSLTISNRKRSRRNRSPRPRTRDISLESPSRKHARHSSRDRRKTSPRQQARSSRSPTRSRPRSPAKSDSGSRRADREAQSQLERPQPRSRSRSLTSEHHLASSRRARASSREDQRTSGLERISSRRQLPPRSPPASRERRSREGSPEAILEEAITRSITKNHISVTISIPHHPNTLRTITRLHDHPTGHHVVDGMVISPTHLSILKGVVTVPQVALLAIIIPILHGHRHTPLRQARCSSTLRGGSYRGGYRGGGFRGRGRGGFKNSHWNSGPPSRGHHDDLGNERFSNVDDHGNTGSEPMDVQEEVFQSHDELGEDTSQSVQDRAGPLTTPNRPPPSGPGGSSASSRPRHERRHPPEGPRVAPRMRKVMKIMKRPKPRPTLPADLVDSESVFFRKPGNESVVGSGTYGKVFKGLNVYTKGMVALKRIRMEGERDGFPVTAIREIKLLQSLRHVNIVNLQEVMVEKNDCFMVFEYLSHDLTGLLNHPTFKLETAQKKDLAKQMFEGLDYLHTRGVLHRDIKAANILVSNEGVLKIADFGLARFYAKRHQLDYTNRVITIWYRSPELLLGETKYTAAVDVWSAACVMVEIFDRNAIFPGDGTELSQLEKIYNVMGTPNLKDWPNLIDMAWFELLRPTVKRRNVFAEKYRDKMSPAAFDLLSAMFHYDPAKRPSAAQVLQHAYFTEEAPAARQATELATHNDWHEFESKALRKENDRREREAKKLAKENAGRDKEKDKKRINEGTDQRDTKRLQVDKNGGNKPTPAVAPPNSTSEA